MAQGDTKHNMKSIRIWLGSNGKVIASGEFEGELEDASGNSHRIHGNSAQADLGVKADAKTKTLADIFAAVVTGYKAQQQVPAADSVTTQFD